MSRPLLPGNATSLERLAGEALTQIERVPVPIRQLVDPDLCPVELLPYLAWAFSVDRWEPSWSESIKRQVIRRSYLVHAHKGTIGALRRVVEPLGYLIEVSEWWQQVPTGEPGTFRLVIGVLDTGITEAMYEELTWLIDDAKPLSRHLVGLAISLEVKGRIPVSVAQYDGDSLTVYPYLPGEIEVTGNLSLPGREHTIDTMSVYPWP